MTATGRKRRTLRIDDPVGPRAVATDERIGGSAPNGRLRELPIAEIRPNPSQPRKHFDSDSLATLAASVRERGVIQPVIVRPRPEGGYELVAGERRWRAARLAGLATVPALVDEQLDGVASLEVALIENMAREDLNPVEEARACAALTEELGLSREEVGLRVGKSRVAVSNLIRLLELPDEALAALQSGELSEGHGRALLLASDHDARRRLARAAVAEGWSVRELERRARELAEPRRRRPAAPHPDQEAAIAEISEALETALGRPVSVSASSGGYRVQLRFQSADDALALARALGTVRIDPRTGD